MIKLQAEINDGRYDLNCGAKASRCRRMLLDARIPWRYTILLRGVFLLRSGTNVYHCRVETGG